DGTVLFIRLHHAIGDGVALMTVLLALTDFPDESGHIADGAAAANPFFRVLMRSGNPDDARREAERLMPETLRLMLAPAEALARSGAWTRAAGSAAALLRLAGRPRDTASPLKGRLGVEKRLAWTPKLPIEDVRRIGRARGASINDVLNSTLAG